MREGSGASGFPEFPVSAELAPSGATLGERYRAFLALKRRALLAEAAAWMLEQVAGPASPEPVIPDVAAAPPQPRDEAEGRWDAPAEEFCYRILRHLGFPDAELRVAVLAHAERRDRRTVTLWLESPADAWVIDPTGVVAAAPTLRSELGEWRTLTVARF